jgi:DNA-directed RNA polymerase specialized sigma24 family protein
MTLPSERQALVFWLHATGMTCRQMAELFKCSADAARSHLVQAQQKARKVGLSYKIELKPQPETPDKESGMGIALRLAREANLIQ